MTLNMHISFECDDCGNEWDPLEAGGGLPAALEELQQNGWSVRNNLHFCPACIFDAAMSYEGETD